jgi:hypothetical protein
LPAATPAASRHPLSSFEDLHLGCLGAAIFRCAKPCLMKPPSYLVITSMLEALVSFTTTNLAPCTAVNFRYIRRVRSPRDIHGLPIVDLYDLV